MSPPKIAIVAAHPGELQPLVKGWSTAPVKYGRNWRHILQRGRSFAIVAGMGAEPARVAARAVVDHTRPDLLISAGWAGSLRPELGVSAIVIPEVVIHAADGRGFRTFAGAGTLVTTELVLDATAKAEIAHRFSAQAVDMEAAAVGEVAQETATRFLAVKSIFDKHDFALPPLTRFVASKGRFRYASFLAWLALRPSQWPVVLAMQRNSSRSAHDLALFLEKLLACDSLVELQRQIARQVLGIPL